MSRVKLTLGFYENFPTTIHRVDCFNSALSSSQLQQRLIKVFYETNGKEFSFEEVTNPTIPQGKVIFEFGLAELGNFNYLDLDEVKKTIIFLSKERLYSLDFFCSIRYYKGISAKKTPLKFDYYMLRTIFSRNLLEVQVFHERGPRYISPEELTTFIFTRLNETQSKNRKILKKKSI